MKNIVIISDIDGILTDGKTTFTQTPDGVVVSKSYGSYDLEAIQELENVADFVFVTSSRNGIELHNKRLLEVGHSAVGASGIERNILISRYLDYDRVYYIGDSNSDANIAKNVIGTIENLNTNFLTVANATNKCKEIADYVAERAGGSGGFAECLEYIKKLECIE